MHLHLCCSSDQGQSWLMLNVMPKGTKSEQRRPANRVLSNGGTTRLLVYPVGIDTLKMFMRLLYFYVVDTPENVIKTVVFNKRWQSQLQNGIMIMSVPQFESLFS